MASTVFCLFVCFRMQHKLKHLYSCLVFAVFFTMRWALSLSCCYWSLHIKRTCYVFYRMSLTSVFLKLYIFFFFIVVRTLSHVWLLATHGLQTPGFLSLTIFQSLLKLMPIELVKPYNHLIPCCHLLLLSSIFPIVKVFSNESALHIRWPRYWSFIFSISPSNEYLGLISFRMD